MLRYAVFVLVALAACGVINCKSLNNVHGDINLAVVENATEYLRQNDVVILYTLKKSVAQSAEPRNYYVQYYAGSRVSGEN